MGLYPNYIVGVGETIRDVVINATGAITIQDSNGNTIDNWNLILDANDFTDWTPILIPGQSVIIPDDVLIDANTLRTRQTYPSNNSTVMGVYNLINAVWALLTDRWILKTGFWDDGGLWIDTDFWIDQL